MDLFSLSIVLVALETHASYHGNNLFSQLSSITHILIYTDLPLI